MSKKIIQMSARLGDKFKAFSRVKSEQARPIGASFLAQASLITAGRGGLRTEAQCKPHYSDPGRP